MLNPEQNLLSYIRAALSQRIPKGREWPETTGSRVPTLFACYTTVGGAEAGKQWNMERNRRRRKDGINRATVKIWREYYINEITGFKYLHGFMVQWSIKPPALMMWNLPINPPCIKAFFLNWITYYLTNLFNLLFIYGCRLKKCCLTRK